MSSLKQTIAQLFGVAQTNGSVEQVEPQAVVAATAADTAEPTETPTETPADPETPAETPAPVETPAAEPVAVATAAAAPSVAMASIEVSVLAALQLKADAYDGIEKEYKQLKAWHTAAQGGVGVGPDANMATETKPKFVSESTRRAQEMAKARGLVE